MGFGFSTVKKLLPNLHGISLTLKALILTVSVGIVFWAFNNYFQTEYQKKVFNDYLLVELHKRAQSDWGSFDSHLRIQMQAGKLLVERSNFIEYIEGLEAKNWADDENVTPSTTILVQPKWLPKRSIVRGLVNSSHFILLDPKNRIREVFQNSLKKLPDTLLPNLYDDMVGITSRNTILVDNGKPFLFAKVALLNEDKLSRATLILVTAIDDDFLLNLQLESRSEGVLVFLDQEGTRVVASSRPDLVHSGVKVETLKEKYLILEKSFFDYGFLSEYFVQFATLIPISQIKTLNDAISYAGRTQRGFAHIVMIVLTIMIVVWLVGHIKDFTNEMLHFTREYLGFEPSKAKGGDQLQVMKDQFKLLSNEIIAARKQESIHKEELLETNQALSQSLVMVKRTQTQLVEAEKMAALGGLVAGVAHEINTPLGIGMTAASFLQRRCKESANLLAEEKLKRSELDTYFSEATESSTLILTNLTRAAKLIRSFKQVAVDQASEDKRIFNLKNYIDQVLTSFNHRLRNTTHSITVSCPDDLECNTYPGVLSQIITNFIENSLIHGYKEKDSGEMLIDISVAAGHLVFKYRDDGSGITEENRKRIFEPFFTTNRSQGGSGLGMNIVYNLVTQTIGGKIECISEPGKGVEFIIICPEVDNDGEPFVA
ncbi:MAG: HAMP domain-containing histidine kinase [Magnetococcales bacterium]|nr:HAMP domain-containing histidine kinase [Magnetococcales bacterium]